MDKGLCQMLTNRNHNRCLLSWSRATVLFCWINIGEYQPVKETVMEQRIHITLQFQLSIGKVNLTNDLLIFLTL